MNLFQYLWQSWLLSCDEEELFDRSVDGSCSDAWACHVMLRNRWRRIIIRRARMRSRSLPVLRMIGAAFMLYLRPNRQQAS
jgi:hypothetical protein